MREIKKPERCIKLTLEMQGDTWEDIKQDLEYLSYRINEGPITSIVSGGHSSSYIATGRENPEQTHDNYVKQNAEYVKSLKQGESGE